LRIVSEILGATVLPILPLLQILVDFQTLKRLAGALTAQHAVISMRCQSSSDIVEHVASHVP
jgi:hypothetical protein